MPLFENGEFKLMLSDWLTILHTHLQSCFHVFLMICKRGVGCLPFNFCWLELRMCLIFIAWDIQDSLDVLGLGFSATVQRFIGICLLPFWTKTVFNFPFNVYGDFLIKLNSSW